MVYQVKQTAEMAVLAAAVAAVMPLPQRLAAQERQVKAITVERDMLPVFSPAQVGVAVHPQPVVTEPQILAQRAALEQPHPFLVAA